MCQTIVNEESYNMSKDITFVTLKFETRIKATHQKLVLCHRAKYCYGITTNLMYIGNDVGKSVSYFEFFIVLPCPISYIP